MEDNILKLKELLVLNYKIIIKANTNMSNPNKRSPLIIQLVSGVHVAMEQKVTT